MMLSCEALTYCVQRRTTLRISCRTTCSRTVLSDFPSEPSSLLAFVFLIHRQLTLFGEWTQLGMLVQYGTYRVYDKGMKSARGVEGVFWCFD